MATPYQAIYDKAIFRFRDYDVLRLTFQTEANLVLERFLKSAEADFAPVCQFDLNNCDAKLAQYNEDLDNECIEILALGISAYWLSAQSLDKDLLRNRMSTKEYSYFSPGNLLDAVTVLRNTLMNEFQSKVIRYSYRHGDIASLKV